MNPLRTLGELGQSAWLDYRRRTLLTGGDLDRLIRQDGVRGVTAHPGIFEKAIAGSGDYDDALRDLVTRDRHAPVANLYETLVHQDIRLAADLLRPVYDDADGTDGFVSLGLPPDLARDTDGTVREARRRWRQVSRPNVMIEVPATEEGIRASEILVAEGINVNVTLVFSLTQYEAVASAYVRALERAATSPGRVASVASFFVNRVDTAVDRALERVGTASAARLRGTIAVANAKRAYRRYRALFHGDAFAGLRERGARPQRVLWTGTAVRDPACRDVRYVEALIGPETVHAMAPGTLSAFRDHGQPRASLLENLEEADAVIAALGEAGIELDAIAEGLQRHALDEGAAAVDRGIEALEDKRRALQGERVATATYALGDLESRVRSRLERWQAVRFGRRVWEKDPTVWFESDVDELTNRLGWLDLPGAMPEQLDEVTGLADEIRSEGVSHIVLLGMGGSSLAPEVFARTFGQAEGFPSLTVLDTTHPDAVRAVRDRLDGPRTLVVVSSKSGTTLETLSLFRAFWHVMGRDAGRRFVAITDPGTPLQTLAEERGFRRVVHAPPEVGGRYSALSVFGLVPAALVGVDVRGLLDRAWTMAEASAFCVPETASPGLRLGAALGELAETGRDKVTFFTSPRLAAFPAWLEQLIAESVGKRGKGIVPVADEPVAPAVAYGADRVFVTFSLDSDAPAVTDPELRALREAGQPVVQIRLRDPNDLGREMFRWELAVAAASAVIGVHPFDQPDVQLAKDMARRAMSGRRGDVATADGRMTSLHDGDEVATLLREWIGTARDGDYVGIHAYLAPSDEITARLQQLRHAVAKVRSVATTVGYGPRFLHSTGQLHKGGPNSGLFLQLVDDPIHDLAVPETDYTFGTLIRAQAEGDYGALRQRNRRVLRLHLGTDPLAGIATLVDVLD